MVITQNKCTHLSLMRVLIVECEFVRTCVLAHTIPYLIIDIRHEVAFLDVQHFVEAVRNMKPESVGTVHFVKATGGFDDFPREPFAVGTGEL